MRIGLGLGLWVTSWDDLLLSLHNMIITQPLQLMMTLIHRRRMQTNRLIIGTIAESLPVADEQFGVEGPANYGGGDEIVVTVYIGALGNVEELAAAAGESGSFGLFISGGWVIELGRGGTILVEGSTFSFRER